MLLKRHTHLRDTVEVLQVRRVLRKLNRFLELMHTGRFDTSVVDSRIDAARALQEEVEVLPQLQGELKSLFEVWPEWLVGELSPAGEKWRGELEGLEAHLEQLAAELAERRSVRWSRGAARYRREGTAAVDPQTLQVLPRAARGSEAAGRGDQLLQKAFTVQLRTRPGSSAVLLRCEASAGEFELNDAGVDRLYQMQRRLGAVRVSVEPGRGRRSYLVRVGVDLLFGVATAQVEELEAAVARVVAAAVALQGDVEVAEAGGVMPGVDARVAAMIEERVAGGARGGVERWEWDGEAVVVRLRDGRSQRVRVACGGGVVRVVSTVLGAPEVTRSARRWRELALRAWVRNGRKALVAFGFDAGDALVGVLEQPLVTLDAEELEHYVDVVALECDRFEFAVVGVDRG